MSPQTWKCRNPGCYSPNSAKHTRCIYCNDKRPMPSPDAAELLAALKELVARCDGPEGVTADGSNICTLSAHAIINRSEKE